VSAVDVAVSAADAWVDVMPLLPSVLSNADTNSLLHHLLTSAQKKGQWSNAQVFKQFFYIGRIDNKGILLTWQYF
jgi:hypothetical protein